MRKHAGIVLLLLMLCPFLITGCGKDKALEDYKAAISSFYDDMVAQAETIDSIDPASENAVTEFLSALDEMNTLFMTLAELEVPKEFIGAESLADEASENMSQAVALYHNAYEDGEEFDSYTAEAAYAYYERALKRVGYIGDVLSGNIPDDENVTVITEEETGSLDNE